MVQSCRNGDSFAYETLVKVYAQYIFAICFAMIGNSHDAEDLAQQALLKGFTSIKNIQNSQRFKPWISQIAKNLCIDFLRRQKLTQAALAEKACSSKNQPKEYSHLLSALIKLDEEYRVPLILYYFDGQSAITIAQTLQISQNAAQARISRARKQLRKLLSSEEI